MTSSQLTLTPIPALKDNYIWCLAHHAKQQALIVDPGEAEPILRYLSHYQLQLNAILVTHHHADHTAGIAELKKNYPHTRVIGPANENIPLRTEAAQPGNRLSLSTLGIEFEVLDIPGHTMGHVAYFNDTWLFCGDTLFSCGCGRIFEGTHEMMYHSLEKLRNLDDCLLVCCAHEYTLQNIKFAQTVLPDSVQLKAFQEKVIRQRTLNLPSLPIPLGVEKQLNPFLNCNQPGVIKAVRYHEKSPKITDPIQIFASLREWKNEFS
ncbi:MAG: hydroxyacylglutathione hydrolase [Gammaproteobacteria bacterium]